MRSIYFPRKGLLIVNQACYIRLLFESFSSANGGYQYLSIDPSHDTSAPGSLRRHGMEGISSRAMTFENNPVYHFMMHTSLFFISRTRFYYIDFFKYAIL